MALHYKIAGGMVEDNNGCDCSCTIFPVDFNSPSLH